MRLIVAHKIFISSSMAAAAVLAVTRLLRWRTTGDPSALWLALAAIVAIPLMSLYLRHIWRR
jgi:hypothetical protein